MKIHHTAITVLSLEKSIEFYQEVFGLKVESTFFKKDLGAKLVMLSDGSGGKIELFQFDQTLPVSQEQNNFSAQGIKHVAFESEDVDRMWNKLKDKYECTDIVRGVSAQYFFIKDPNNIPLEIYKSIK